MASWIAQGARKLKDIEGVNGTYILSAMQASVTRMKLKFIQAENIRAKERVEYFSGLVGKRQHHFQT
jgi:hypothetical protein